MSWAGKLNEKLRAAEDDLVQDWPERFFGKVEIPPGAPSAILGLRTGHCRWPHGDPGSADFRFCAAPCDPIAPYCADCTRRRDARGSVLMALAAE